MKENVWRADTASKTSKYCLLQSRTSHRGTAHALASQSLGCHLGSTTYQQGTPGQLASPPWASLHPEVTKWTRLRMESWRITSSTPGRLLNLHFLRRKQLSLYNSNIVEFMSHPPKLFLANVYLGNMDIYIFISDITFYARWLKKVATYIANIIGRVSGSSSHRRGMR